MTKPTAWSERTKAVLDLSGSQAPLDKGKGKHLSANDFVQWEIVPEIDDQGNPVLINGKPKLKSVNPTITKEGLDYVGRLAQQGTYESAVMRTEQQLRELASENVRKDKNFQSKLNAPEIIRKKAKTIFKTDNPTDEQLTEAKELIRDGEIEREILRLRKEGRFQSGGRVLSTPPPVGLPSIQQMME